MNECDADRVLQIREAVRAQAHCELPAVEKLGDAIGRWWTEPVEHISPIGFSIFIWLALGIGVMLGRLGNGKSSRKSS